jgi:hypothetical protein
MVLARLVKCIGWAVQALDASASHSISGTEETEADRLHQPGGSFTAGVQFQ